MEAVNIFPLRRSGSRLAFYLLLSQPFFATDTSSETGRTDMFVQGCMQETEPRLHRYVGQHYHSHTTGAYSTQARKRRSIHRLSRNCPEGQPKRRVHSVQTFFSQTADSVPSCRKRKKKIVSIKYL